MIAKKTLLLMVMGLAGRENGGKAKNCRVLRRILARVLARSRGLSPGSVCRHPQIKAMFCAKSRIAVH